MIVRGVYRDIPENTMFKADFVVSVHKEGGYKDGAGWGGNDIFYAVIRTGEASDIEVVNDNIQRMVEKYMPTEHNGWKLELSVIPLATKHQTSSETTKRLVIYGFLGFSIFFVAIMNYMLIVIATLGRRAKSVGVHKCNGANNGNIFSMFMMETGIIVLVSILVCAFIIFNARDLIEDLLSVRLASLFTWGTLWVPLLVVVLLFLLAGVLPGRIFSHIPVTQVFRRYTDGKKGWKRSLLFIQFTGVSFVLGLLLANRSTQKALRLQQRAAVLQAENDTARYTALQNQLNPHFLFNSLNTLIAEIEYNPQNAVHFTKHLSSVYRYVLQSQDKTLVTLGEELEFIRSYLFLHEVRLGNCLTCQNNVPAEYAEKMLPPLTLQLLVENVIKHNSITPGKPMVITIRIEDDYLSVSNPIHPKKSVASSGIGLENLAKRCELMSGKKIIIKNETEKFTVKVPLLYE
jgi:hypothetical protein